MNFKSRSTYLLTLALTILFFALLQIAYSLRFQQLPACLHGCDLYSHLGTLYHLAYGGDIFQNGQLTWAKPWTPQLYHLLVVLFAKLSGLEVLSAQIWFNVPLYIVTAVILAYLVEQIFENEWLSLLSVLLLSERFPVYKYGDFSFLVTLPFFVFVSYFFIFKRDRRPRNLLLSSFFYGLTGYSHTVTFVGINLYLVLCLIAELWENREAKRELMYSMLSYTKLVLLGIPIALLYWWWPLANWLKATNPSGRYGDKDFSRISVSIGESWEYFKRFFYLNDPGFFTVLVVFGTLGYLFVLRKKLVSPLIKKFTSILLLTSFIGMNHHWITAHTVGLTVFPGFFALLFLLPILICFFYLLLILSERYIRNNALRKILFGVLLIITFLPALQRHRSIIAGERYYRFAYAPLPPHYPSLKAFLEKQSDLGDVILTAKELCFAVNGLTGRKCMTYRTTHTDPFSDVWKNQVDAALILYGEDPDLALELLDKYQVKYLYWEELWKESEFQLKEGSLVPYDPLLVPDSVDFREILKKNGVVFKTDRYWFDPAYRGEDIPQLEGILISAENYRNRTIPWRESLDKHLKQVWSYAQNGKTVAKLYMVSPRIPSND